MKFFALINKERYWVLAKLQANTGYGVLTFQKYNELAFCFFQEKLKSIRMMIYLWKSMHLFKLTGCKALDTKIVVKINKM